MSKIKMMRNLKNSAENALFVCVVLTFASVFATLLYIGFKVWWAAEFAAKLVVLFLILNTFFLVSTQVCDIVIWRIKASRRRKSSAYPTKIVKRKKIPISWKINRFVRAMGCYSFF